MLTYEKGQNCEISQILALKRRIIAVGWQRSIAVFRESEFKEASVSVSRWEGEESHADDILCCGAMRVAPLLLATGSFDGEIVVWNSSSEFANRRLTARQKTAALVKEGTAQSLRAGRRGSLASALRRPTVNMADSDVTSMCDWEWDLINTCV